MNKVIKTIACAVSLLPLSVLATTHANSNDTKNAKAVTATNGTNESATNSPKTGPEVDLIKKITQNQVTIVQQFSSVGNLTGFVIKSNDPDGRQAIVYVDKQGKYMIVGSVINAQGQNLAQMDTQKYIQPKVAAKALKAAKTTTWFLQGKADAPHKAVVIAEPNCSVCHMLYEQLKPSIDSGQLAVRWILVHFIKPSSLGKAAAILQAKDPAKAMDDNEKGFDMQTESGAISPLKNIPDDVKTKLNNNNKFMSKMGFNGTPVMLYTDKQGKAKLVQGLPQKSQLPNIINSMSNQF